MLKRIVVFLWNHCKFLRSRLGKHIVVQCRQCGTKIKGKDKIEEWIVMWHLCRDCSGQRVMTLFRTNPEALLKA